MSSIEDESGPTDQVIQIEMSHGYCLIRFKQPINIHRPFRLRQLQSFWFLDCIFNDIKNNLLSL